MSEAEFEERFKAFAIATAAWINRVNEEFKLAAERIRYNQPLTLPKEAKIAPPPKRP